MSFIFAAVRRSLSSIRAASYGGARRLRQIAYAAICAALLGLAGMSSAQVQTKPVRIVALGDSLTAGLGLPANDGFVPRLQAALADKGVATDITNAGVSGDTASGGLARLDWSVPAGTDAVIV